MLKGHTFKEQVFGNPIFALFIDTFTNGRCGVSKKWKNEMALTYSGSTLTIQSGAVCIKGRFLEEDTSTTLSAGTDTAFCKLVIDINLDKVNTSTNFLQGEYKIIKSSTGYPELTQNDIIRNASGIYQYELARFKTNSNGITEFQDMRTFLDFNSIYDAIDTQVQNLINILQQEIEHVKDGSAFLLKTQIVSTENTDLNNYIEDGTYYFSTNYTPLNVPSTCVNGWLRVMKGNSNSVIKQVWYRHGTVNANDFETYVRTKIGTSGWSNWKRYITNDDAILNEKQKKILVGTAAPSGGSNGDIYIQYF